MRRAHRGRAGQGDGREGTVAILAGNQSAPNLQNRVAGAKEALKKYPNMKLNEPGVFYHVETPEKAAEAVQQAQNANPGIQGWAMIGGLAALYRQCLKWPAGSIKVVAVDALPAQLGYVKRVCGGAPGPGLLWLGTKSVEILLDKIVKNQAPPDVKVIDPLTLVTKENVDSYAENWKKWLKK